MKERTERPTKQKLKKARKKGEVAKSPFFAGAIVFVGGFLLLWGTGSILGSRFAESMRAGLKETGLKEIELEGSFHRVIGPLIFPVSLFLFGIFVIALASHLAQTGWVWSVERIQPKWRKKRTIRRFFLPILQFGVIAAAGYLAIRAKLDPNFLFAPSKIQGEFLFKKIMILSIWVGGLLLFLGLCDFFYQKWRYYKMMHMTREEKKEELRETEGDPHIKSRFRHRRE